MQFAFELCVMYHQQFLMDFSELKSWTVYDAIFITISELKPNRVNQLDLKPIGKTPDHQLSKSTEGRKKCNLLFLLEKIFIYWPVVGQFKSEEGKMHALHTRRTWQW